MCDYANIRELIGEFIGQKVIEITQHDEEYFKRTGRSFIDLMFDSGDVLRIYVLIDDLPGVAVNPTEEMEKELFNDGEAGNPNQ